MLMCTSLYAQTISINALVVDENIPEEATRQLETKLQSALTANGYADNGYTERFVLTAKVNITQKDIASTTPVRISEKMDIILMVGDVVENKNFASVTIQTTGIGINDNKAFISAFHKINGNNPQIQQMLNDAKTKITDYYTVHCPEIIMRAQGLVSKQAFDEAISLLTSVPNLCEDCFIKCQQQSIAIYQQKIDYEATELLEKAKTIWATHQNVDGANKVADIIGQINPQSTHYAQVVSMREIVSAKLNADERRDWDFKMKQYEDKQLFKRSIIDTVKTVGVAWAQHQPSTIYKTIVRSWW